MRLEHGKTYRTAAGRTATVYRTCTGEWPFCGDLLGHDGRCDQESWRENGRYAAEYTETVNYDLIEECAGAVERPNRSAPALPQTFSIDNLSQTVDGLSKRELIAAMALLGILAGGARVPSATAENMAVEFADALLSRLAETGKKAGA